MHLVVKTEVIIAILVPLFSVLVRNNFLGTLGINFMNVRAREINLSRGRNGII